MFSSQHPSQRGNAAGHEACGRRRCRGIASRFMPEAELIMSDEGLCLDAKDAFDRKLSDAFCECAVKLCTRARLRRRPK